MVTVIAKSIKGQEYLYSQRDIYLVSKASAKLAAETLNKNNWNLKDNQTWFIHELSEYELQWLVPGKIMKRKDKFIIYDHY